MLFFCSSRNHIRQLNICDDCRQSNARHAAHDTEDVIIYCVHTHLGGRGTRNGARGEHQLEHGVVNAREVARSTRLVFLRAQREGVHVDTGIRSTGVVLEGLHHVEVGAFAFREAVLAVELQLGSDNGVLTPAVHVQGGLGEDKGAGIGHVGAHVLGVEGEVHGGSSLPVGGGGGAGVVHGTSSTEEATGDHEVAGGGLGGATERVDGVGEGVNGVGVVEGLGTQGLEEDLGVVQGGAVVDVGVGLHNPDELLARVVEVQLNLVGGGTHGLVTSELHLLDEVLVGVLGHLAALVSVEEDIVDVERGRHQGLLVRHTGRHGAGAVLGGEGLDRPEALTHGADIKVNLNFVVLYEPLLPPLSGYLLAFFIFD